MCVGLLGWFVLDADVAVGMVVRKEAFVWDSLRSRRPLVHDPMTAAECHAFALL